MGRYDTFLLDADDTILDFHVSSKMALDNGFKELGINFKKEYLDIFFEVNDKLWTALERKEITRKELMATRFQIYFNRLGKGEYGEIFNTLYLEYLSTHPVFIDGAKEFLEKLQKLGRIYIITNGTYKIQRKRFEISHLYDYAEDVFVSENVGWDKPDKRYIDYVIKEIPNFNINKSIVIGDSLHADIKLAQIANIDSIWFNLKKEEGKRDIKPKYIVENYENILKIIENAE